MSSCTVIGSGLIGSAFRGVCASDIPVMFFASGVSNSKSTNAKEFQREVDALNKIIESLDENTLLVYFSSCGVRQLSSTYKDTYLEHKYRMERLVAKFGSHLIIRLPQVAGFSKNKNTLLNYFYDSISLGRKMSIQSAAVRNVIDIDDVVKLTLSIIRSNEYRNCVVDVASLNSMLVLNLMRVMESHLGVFANFDLIDGGGDYPVDLSVVARFASEINILFDEYYVNRVIAKYYSSGRPLYKLDSSG